MKVDMTMTDPIYRIGVLFLVGVVGSRSARQRALD